MPTELPPLKQKTTKRSIKWFIGVDVSKHTLDYAVIYQEELLFHQQRPNSRKDIAEFILQLKKLPKFSMKGAIFCMEATGIYGHHLLTTVHVKRGKISQVNPLMIKRFMGVVRGKTDKADATRIATYAKKNLDELLYWAPPRQEITQLKGLFTLRERMRATALALRTPLDEQEIFLQKASQQEQIRLCEKTIHAIDDDLQRIETKLDELIIGDESLDRLMRLVTSVPGIGRITAMQLMICTNEFKDISCPKKFACYAGVAPFPRASGLVIKKARTSPIANQKMKALLHMCATNAMRYNAELKAYYEKKTKEEGKPKMLVINSIRNKLIARIFACVNQNREFQTTVSNDKYRVSHV